MDARVDNLRSGMLQRAPGVARLGSFVGMRPEAGGSPAIDATVNQSPAPSSLRALLRQRAKRAIDCAGSASLLLIMLPTLLIIAAAVAADGGPVFYAHRRIGRDGREFGCLKFRSMRPNADQALAALLANDAAARAEWTETRKLRNDPRVTRLGRLLRKTSLDELPQLLNVLKGEMSLVGPRPVTRDELNTFYAEAGSSAYLSVRPGITGPWQVSGRSETGYQERVVLDTTYARNLSLRADIAILFRTLDVVLRRRGAF